jgi:hypothetical protein
MRARDRSNSRLAVLGIVLGAAGIVGPSVAQANPTVDLIWDATTNPGSGLGVGTSTIKADPGDQLTLGIYLTMDSAGVSNYVVSIEYDNDLVDELDLVSAVELTPAPLTNTTVGVVSSSESSGSQGGTVYSFEAGSVPGNGPTSTTVQIGTITFTVTGAVATDGTDVESGLFSVLVDGIYSNAASGDLSATAVFNGAGVDRLSGAAVPGLMAWGVLWLAVLLCVAALATLRRRAAASP